MTELSGRERTREIVRIRDEHKCQDCKKGWKTGQRRFDIHHLNGLCGKKSRKYDRVSEIAGLITLCHKCHFNRPEHAVKKFNVEMAARNRHMIEFKFSRYFPFSDEEVGKKFGLTGSRVQQIREQFKNL